MKKNKPIKSFVTNATLPTGATRLKTKDQKPVPDSHRTYDVVVTMFGLTFYRQFEKNARWRESQENWDIFADKLRVGRMTGYKEHGYPYHSGYTDSLKKAAAWTILAKLENVTEQREHHIRVLADLQYAFAALTEAVRLSRKKK